MAAPAGSQRRAVRIIVSQGRLPGAASLSPASASSAMNKGRDADDENGMS
jgi:hypothetical protein